MVSDRVIKVIKITENTKKELDNNKIYRRETYDDIILRLVRNQKEVKDGR